MVQSKKHVERIPEDWIDSVRPRVVRGRKFKDAVAEIFAANAQLLALERNHSRQISKVEKVRKPHAKG
jgi:hypothetical protein